MLILIEFRARPLSKVRRPARNRSQAARSSGCPSRGRKECTGSIDILKIAAFGPQHCDCQAKRGKGCFKFHRHRTGHSD